VSPWLAYFHIKDGSDLIRDPEGSELATVEDARRQALMSAKELCRRRSLILELEPIR
jgi:hypothetical protein